MRELSIFADESGDRAGNAKYYLLTLVLHDQSEDIARQVGAYERSLSQAGLPDIPFHSEPLLNGHDEYKNVEPEDRKRLLSSFSVLAQRLPYRYKTFAYLRREVADPEVLSAKMRRDVSAYLFEYLAFFQQFNQVKIYYDNGQDIVKKALDASVAFALSKQAVISRKSSMQEYRLAQVADYLCTIELAAVKFAAKEDGGTYEKFFGTIGKFKKNWLKQARRKLMA